MNKVIISGRVVADPEIKSTKEGMHFVAFTVACDKGKDKGADFIDCIAFEKTAESIGQYFCKGKPITVEGRINVKSFEDKEGKKRKTVTVAVDRFEFALKDNTENRSSADVSVKDNDEFTEVGYPDDLPF